MVAKQTGTYVGWNIAIISTSQQTDSVRAEYCWGNNKSVEKVNVDIVKLFVQRKYDQIHKKRKVNMEYSNLAETQSSLKTH